MWNLSPRERLAQWRQFRNDLNQYSHEQALEKITNLWSYVPFVDRYLEAHDPRSWPDPWRLIWENRYCDLARALGMLYTWELSQLPDQLPGYLNIYFDHSEQKPVHCFCLGDNDFVLNLSYNSVLKKHCFTNNYELIHTYPSKQLIEK